MLRFFALALLALLSAPSRAATPLAGLWLTGDRGGVIAISPCDGGLCARIVGVFLDRADDPMPLDYRGMSQCDLPLITDARQIGANLWKGHILDPRNGTMYGVELHLDPKGNLAVRGFLGIPLLGETQTWTRYTGAVPADCRIAPNPNLADRPASGTMTKRR
jgi:uncharacterized protein (DUF2147 family)